MNTDRAIFMLRYVHIQNAAYMLYLVKIRQ